MQSELMKYMYKTAHPVLKLRDTVCREYTDEQFMFVYYISMFKSLQKKMNLPLEIVMLHVLPAKQVAILLAKFKDFNYANSEGEFSPHSSEFDLNCFLQCKN